MTSNTDPNTDQVTANRISESSVFLVSGGARGITAQCVITLARYFPCRWILLGRSDLSGEEPQWARNGGEESQMKKRIIVEWQSRGQNPSPADVQKTYQAWRSRQEIQKTLSTLRQLGRKTEYISVDITDVSLLGAKLAPVVTRLGTVTGIIHGAGSLADKLIERKTLQDFEKVYAPKVKGLENLLCCVSLQHLEYLVLFSSVVGFYGNAGQTDYALANEILNKSAHWVKRHYPQCHAIAINWGPWDFGMVTPELKAAFAQRNVKVLPVEGATKMLLKELDGRSQPATQVVIGDPLPPAQIVLDDPLQTHRLQRRLRLEDNPFLQDHVIGGHPVLPFTCAIGWMATSCEQLYPGYQFVNSENLRVLKGIVFDKNVANNYILEVQEIIKNDQKIVLETKILSQTQEKKIHYRFAGKIELRQQIPENINYDLLDLKDDQKITKIRQDFYQKEGETLFHGSFFQGVDQVLNITPQRITIKGTVKAIKAEQQGQFPVQTINPYIADIQSHGIWIFSQYFYNLACLPSKIDKFEQFRVTPFEQPFYVSTNLKSKTNSIIKCDIISHDETGKVYTYISGAEATLMPSSYLNNGKLHH